MIRISLILIFFLTLIIDSNAQKNINTYKYVVVPQKYDFLREKDQYQLNSLTKFLFEKYGFTAFMQNETFPDDLKVQGCNALYANVIKKQGLMAVKLTVELIDCKGNRIYESIEGKSRKKKYKDAYHQALRNAFKGVQMLRYSYKETPSKKKTSTTPLPEKNEVADVAKTTQLPTQESSRDKVVGSPSNESKYTFGDTQYRFKKQEYGYELFETDKNNPIGKLYKSPNRKNYIVSAGDLSGSGYFDAYGNFVLERINPVTNKIIVDTFARQ